MGNIISLDTETKDPLLTNKKKSLPSGPGVFRSTPHDYRNEHGYLLGVSMGDEHGNKCYLNLGHYEATKELRDVNVKYLKETLAQADTIIGQNLLYDLDWLENWLGIKVNGTLIDVGVAEALLDENQGKYNLDFMGIKYFGEGEGKAKDKIQQFCDDNNLKGDVRKWLWKMPHYLVEEYAIRDIELPMNIWKIQEPLLEAEDLMPLMNLECDLLRVLLVMRKNGVRIDEALRKSAADELYSLVKEKQTWIDKEVGFPVKFRSSKHLAFIFDENNMPYPMTDPSKTYPYGQPSVPRDHLLRLAKGQLTGFDAEKITDPRLLEIGQCLADLKRADKVVSSFVDGSLLRFQTEGNLIHCSFYPMRTDEYGTRSGRFSSANPNLQQIPSTTVDMYYGTLTRRPFVPLEDHLWLKLDYSQIEYRFMAHFARGQGADAVREQYNFNPRTDYHKMIEDLTGLKRRYAKNLNFGVAYGMGAKHMAEFFQWDLDYCYDILRIYHANAPFIKSTIKAVERRVKDKGYIRTFLKRRSRLIDKNKAYTMFCRLTQGSAADLMKKGMYEVYKAGIFNTLIPSLTVHDEIDCSMPITKEGMEAAREAKHIMETCIELKVPIIADMEIGKNWAKLTAVDKEWIGLTKAEEMADFEKKVKEIA